MTFLKQLFGSKPEKENVNSSSVKGRIDMTEYFHGLDMDYINLLYFSNEKEKEIFISDIARLLNTLNIDDQTNIVTGRKKLIEYNWNNGNETKLLTPSIHLELLHRVYFYKYRESTKTTFVHDIPEHLLNKINEYNNTRKTQ